MFIRDWSRSWVYKSGHWHYEAVAMGGHPVHTGSVDVHSNKEVFVPIPQDVLDQGFVHKIEVRDEAGGLVTVLTRDYVDEGASDLAHRLFPSLKKDVCGEVMSVRVPYDGYLRVFAAQDTLMLIQERRVKAGEEWSCSMRTIQKKIHRPGGYVFCVLTRDVSAVKVEEVSWKKPPEPLSLMGMCWVDVRDESHYLEPRIVLPDVVAPGQKAHVRIALDAAPKEDTYVQLFVVDAASLNGYALLDVAGFFRKKYPFPYRVDDVFHSVVCHAGFTPVVYTVGGGYADGEPLKGSVLADREPIPTVNAGVHKLNKKGEVIIPVSMPDMDGAVTIKAVVWSQNLVGSKEKNIKMLSPVSVAWRGPACVYVGDKPDNSLVVSNNTHYGALCTLDVSGSRGVAFPGKKTVHEIMGGHEHTIPLVVKSDLAGVLSLYVETALQSKKENKPVCVKIRDHGSCAQKDVKSFDMRVHAFPPAKHTQWPVCSGEVVALDEYKFLEGLVFPQTVSVIRSAKPVFVDEETLGCCCDVHTDFEKSIIEGRCSLIAHKDIWRCVQAVMALAHNKSIGAKEYQQYVQAYELLWDAQKEPALMQHREEVKAFLDMIDKALRLHYGFARNDAYGHYVRAKTGKGTLSAIRYAQQRASDTKDPLIMILYGGAFAHLGYEQGAERLWAKALEIFENMLLGDPRAYYENAHLVEGETIVHDLAVFVRVVAEVVKSYTHMDKLKKLLARAQRRFPFLSCSEKIELLRAQDALCGCSKALRHKERVSNIDDMARVVQASNEWALVVADSVRPLHMVDAVVNRELYDALGKKVDLSNIHIGDRLYVFVEVLMSQDNAKKLSNISVMHYIPKGFGVLAEEKIPSAVHDALGRPVHAMRESRKSWGVHMFSQDRYGAMAKRGMVVPVVAQFSGTYMYPPVIVGHLFYQDTFMVYNKKESVRILP